MLFHQPRFQAYLRHSAFSATLFDFSEGYSLDALRASDDNCVASTCKQKHQGELKSLASPRIEIYRYVLSVYVRFESKEASGMKIPLFSTFTNGCQMQM